VKDSLPLHLITQEQLFSVPVRFANRRTKNIVSSSLTHTRRVFRASVSRRLQVQSAAPSDAAGVAAYNAALKVRVVRASIRDSRSC
jgi:hypothetical protein